MGGSKFIPIVIAGIVGLFIGWIVSPDVDDVADQVNGHVDSLKGPIDQIQAQLKSLSDQAAKPAEPAPAPAPSDQPSKTETEIAAIGTKIDQLTSDLQGRIDAVSKAIEEKPAPEPQAAAAASQSGDSQSESGQGGDPAKLASQIGNTGAILLPGQAAMFGGQRVSLASLSAEKGSASIAVGDGDAKDVKDGGAIDVSDNCKVTLAGVAAGAGYFSASDCQGNETSSGQQQAAAGAGAAAAKGTSSNDETKAASGGDQAATSDQDKQKPAKNGAAAEPTASGNSGSDKQAAASGTASEGAAEPAALAANATEATVPVGAAAALGGKRIFVSAIGDNNASLFVAGDFSSGNQTRQTIEVGKTMDAGDGCKVTLAGIENGQAKLTSEGCAKGGSGDKQATASGSDQKAGAAGDQKQSAASSNDKGGSSDTKAADDTAKKAPSQSSGGQQAASSGSSKASGSGGSATEATVPVGGTAALGDKRIFVSGIGDNNASLFVAGDFSSGNQTRQTVSVGKAMDAGDGCKVTLASIENGQAKLTSEGCASGGAAAKSSDSSGSADKAAPGQKEDAAAAGSDKKASAEASASSGSSASTGGEQKPAALGGKQAAANGSALSVGQTGTYGDHKVFVSSLGDGTATLYVVGTGRKAVKTGSSVDLGGGCSVKLDKVDKGAASMSASGC